MLNGSGWPLRTVLSCSVGGVRDAVKRAEGVITTVIGSNSRPTQGSMQLLNKKEQR